MKGGGEFWVGPTKGHFFKLDFPSARFWVKVFFGWVGLRAKRPPLPLKTKPCQNASDVLVLQLLIHLPLATYHWHLPFPCEMPVCAV